MRQTPADRHGLRLRAPIVVLWRGGLRIQEAPSLIESDLDPRRGSILICRGKENRRREGRDGRVGVERSSRAVARRPRRAADRCAVLRDRRTDARAAVVSDRRARRATTLRGGRRCAAQVCAASAPSCSRGELTQERVPLPVIHRQLGHSYVSTTSCLPTRDRCRGDHRHDPCAARADDARQRPASRAQPNRRAGALHGATAAGPRPDSAASRDCGSKPPAAAVCAAERQKCRPDCWISIKPSLWPHGERDCSFPRARRALAICGMRRRLDCRCRMKAG